MVRGFGDGCRKVFRTQKPKHNDNNMYKTIWMIVYLILLKILQFKLNYVIVKFFSIKTILIIIKMEKIKSIMFEISF